MTISAPDPDRPVTTVAITVAVRIPAKSNVDVVTAAQRRIASIDGIRSVSIDELHDIDPRRPATIVTVGGTIDSAVPVDTLRNRLSNVVAVEQAVFPGGTDNYAESESGDKY
jgi:hypothetical protein